MLSRIQPADAHSLVGGPETLQSTPMHFRTMIAPNAQPTISAYNCALRYPLPPGAPPVVPHHCQMKSGPSPLLQAPTIHPTWTPLRKVTNFTAIKDLEKQDVPVTPVSKVSAESSVILAGSKETSALLPRSVRCEGQRTGRLGVARLRYVNGLLYAIVAAALLLGLQGCLSYVFA